MSVNNIIMDLKSIKHNFNDIFERRPNKNVYEECLVDNNSNEEYDKNFIEELNNKVFRSI